MLKIVAHFSIELKSTSGTMVSDAMGSDAIYLTFEQTTRYENNWKVLIDGEIASLW